MKAPTSFETLVSNLLKARFPLLYIPTWEEERAISSINRIVSNEAAIKTTRKLFTWGVTTGLVGDGEASKEETKAPLKALELVEKYSDPAVFVFKDFHTYFGANNRPPDTQVIRRIRDIVPVLKLGALRI